MPRITLEQINAVGAAEGWRLTHRVDGSYSLDPTDSSKFKDADALHDFMCEKGFSTAKGDHQDVHRRAMYLVDPVLAMLGALSGDPQATGTERDTHEPAAFGDFLARLLAGGPEDEADDPDDKVREPVYASSYDGPGLTD